jgi:cytochrome c peroxidase
MNKGLRAVLLYWLLLLLGANFIWSPFKEVRFEVPKGWPRPVYDFKTNKLTAEGIDLGKDLFYDPILSKDSSISCESCHLSFTAFSHPDHKLSHGIAGKVGTRNAPSIVNMAWNNSFMWDGGVNNLEVQPINPIINPLEMGSDLNLVVKKLQRSAKYKKAFYKVYRDSVITSAKVLKVLALFTSNVVSYHSKYDSVSRHLGKVEFTEAEARGYVLFKSNCASCHKEPLFTDRSFRNNGLSVDTFLKDKGRMRITKNISDSLKFKVPTLRNIEFSAPYFHDGRVSKLKDVLEHYHSGIVQSPTLDPLLKNGIAMNKEEKKDLIAFLKTLSDRYYLYNVAYRPNR